MSEKRFALRGHLKRSGAAGEVGEAAGEAGKAADGASAASTIEIDPSSLSGIFAAPKWMRDLGFSSWLLVGVAGAMIGIIWVLSSIHTIVMPVVTAAIVAAVTAPLVDYLNRRGLPRAAGAVAVFLLIVLVGVATGAIILSGLASEASSLSSSLQDGVHQLESWAKGLGADDHKASTAGSGASEGISSAFKVLTQGVATGIEGMASLAVFLSFTALSLFFLLKDGKVIGSFVEGHLGVPQPVAHTILGRVAGSLRGYFFGVTIVSLWSSVLVGGGALLLGVPLAGTIAIVTFIGGYIPYLGAWSAGAFAVLIALGGSGTEAAIGMAIVVLAANGVLQQLVQPIAYGAALKLHPLVVLIVTIAGGCLLGTIGLILAAPLLSAAVRITEDLKAATARATATAGAATTGAVAATAAASPAESPQ